jgi:hypothetical protein
VFDRDKPGFDAIVGNPPFLGGTLITSALSVPYLAWLKDIFPESGDRADLVAYFFRRVFCLLRSSGSFGLLATNTISQGDTRRAGLQWICKNNGFIYRARRWYRWPGEAAVRVNLVHIAKDLSPAGAVLDHRELCTISAFLVPGAEHDDPKVLRTNQGKMYEGFVPYGAGFLFDNATKGAHSVDVMNRILRDEPQFRDVVYPYLSGEDLNEDPLLQARRWVIYFGKMEEDHVKWSWPALYLLVRDSVKPERDRRGKRVSDAPWWQFLWPRPELKVKLKGFQRVFVCSKVSKYPAFGLVDSGMILSNRLAVLLGDSFALFCVVQCRLHEVWARRFSSTLEDRPVYTPSDCFETFPFPEGFETDPRLEEAGREYYEFRAGLVVQNDEGLTKTYNRFHDLDERSNAIGELRRLYDAMDRAVLDAYGWSDLRPTCEFELEWEDDEDEPNGRMRRRRKPWRYRWPEEVRDEVLARLLALNKQRAEQERLELGDRRKRRA